MYKTKNLGLNITEIEKDKLDAFSFKIDLGDNFEAIDSKTITHRNITNCLLEVPQDIKLELKDGAITLKAGSVLYRPNGIGAFEKITINSDVTRSNFDASSNQMLVFYNSVTNIIGWYTLNQNIYSGDAAPANPTTQSVWYDTTENLIKTTADAGVTWTTTTLTLPIAIITRTNGIPTSIDQVFNGYGYIGNTLFELPGVKGLIVDGTNDDGTLKTVIRTTVNVSIDNVIGARSNSGISNLMGTVEGALWLGEFNTHPNTDGVSSPRYLNTITDSIQLYKGTAEGWVTQNGFLQVLEDLKVDSTGKILSMTPKKPFRAVDHNDYLTKITELETKIQALQAAVEALQG